MTFYSVVFNKQKRTNFDKSSKKFIKNLQTYVKQKGHDNNNGNIE